MLNKLLPQQISTLWDVIKFGVQHSVPPTVREKPGVLDRILAACLWGELDVWVSYQKDEENKEIDIEAVSLTQVLYDEASDTSSLLLYSLYAFKHISEKSWEEAFNKVAEYAKSKGCSRIICYTKVDRIIEMAKVFNANTDYTFVSFDL